MKPTIIAIIISGALVLSAFILTQNKTAPANSPPVDNVASEAGKQIVSISAKGGYFPRFSKAKADTPTTLRVETTGTFDCSSALTIPSLNYQKNLPPSGVMDIELQPQKAGTTLKGLCSMGMYEFEIAFQ
ncbi:MAG: cupredoxin domain-containing protein [Patescibacteria group bacterium]